jgi:anti-sigma regulatory factor (Ser/Thr protein kinase)
MGIYLVRKVMDAVSYEYLNGENVLTLEKKIPNNPE